MILLVCSVSVSQDTVPEIKAELRLVAPVYERSLGNRILCNTSADTNDETVPKTKQEQQASRNDNAKTAQQDVRQSTEEIYQRQAEQREKQQEELS